MTSKTTNAVATSTSAMPADFQSYVDALLQAANMGTYTAAWHAFEKGTALADHIKVVSAAK